MKAMVCAVLGSALLAACGGGGSDAGSPAPVMATITASNQDKAGRAAAAATTTMLGAGGGLAATSDAPQGSTTLSSPTGASFGPGRHSVAALVLRASRLMIGEETVRSRLSAGGATATTVRRLTIPSSTVQCGLSGSLTISFTDANGNDQLDIGDSMRLAFNQCSEAAGESINGAMVVGLASVNAGTLLSFSGTVGMESLTVVEDGRTASLNGSLAIGYTEQSATQTQLSLTVGTNGLTGSVSGNGISESLGFYPAFAAVATYTEDGTGAVISSSATINGTLSSNNLGGLVQIETSSAFLHLMSNEYPHAGTARVAGNSSALRMVVLDATKVRLDLDAQGDGTYESSTEVLWTTLLP